MCSGLLFRYPVLLVTCLLLLSSEYLYAQTSSWTGGAGTETWNDPGNWSEGVVPGVSAMVRLDNLLVPGSYRVQLPDQPVTLQSVVIRPSPGNVIELLLPASNTNNDALVLTGSGYPLTLGSGAVFRNACGVSSGASIGLTDSFRIENNGRYIHSTRGTHASSLLAWLSSSPGTERGIFEFDVPRASYTISVSNRIYGTLALRSSAFGLPVNYTCSGSNPLLVRGDLDIGMNVSLSIDLATAKGNIGLLGDLLQQPGTLTLGSGSGDSTRLSLKGNFIQQEGAVITSAPDAVSRVDFDGSSTQILNAGGIFSGNLAVNINNPAGVSLLHALTLHAALGLTTGALSTTPLYLLTLGDTCLLKVDTLNPGAFVDGPLRRQIATGTASTLFPVGAAGARRWLAIENGSGIFTAQYFAENPATLSAQTGAGIDHVSSNEYWRLQPFGSATGKVELSHSVPQSGTITDPSVLRVAQFLQSIWRDEGESAFTGDEIRGSVISNPVADFSGTYFTLGSSLATENPLPLESVGFKVWREKAMLRFNWTWEGPEAATGFDIMQLENGAEKKMGYTKAYPGTQEYEWSMPETRSFLSTRWRVDLIDKTGRRYPGKSVLLPGIPDTERGIFVSAAGGSGPVLFVKAGHAASCVLQFYAVSGALLGQERKEVMAGENRWPLHFPVAAKGICFLRLVFDDGQEKALRVLL